MYVAAYANSNKQYGTFNTLFPCATTAASTTNYWMRTRMAFVSLTVIRMLS